MSGRARALGVSLALASLAPACAEEVPADFGLECEALDFLPCGGDLRGVWTVADCCSEFMGRAPPVVECAESTGTVEMVAVGGISFYDDGTGRSGISLRFVRRIVAPASCRPADKSCTDWIAEVAAAQSSDFEDAVPVFCHEDKVGDCVCTRTELSTIDWDGVYSVHKSGQSVAVQAHDGPRFMEFCTSPIDGYDMLDLQEEFELPEGVVRTVMRLLRVR